ncbi:hypothetical protein GF376_01000 [Candidatus Peregrinibacteria bacterium]|nr:hypothetical protein [Candidatus Peregrinibacteria bacterium]
MTKSTKQIRKIIILSLLAVIMTLFINIITAFGQSLVLPGVEQYDNAVADPGNVQSFESGFASLIVGVVLNLRYLVGAVAIAGLVFAGFLLVTSHGDPEKWKNLKNVIVWSIIGLALAGFAGEFVRIFAVGECAELGLLPGYNNSGCQRGGFLADPNRIIQRTTLFNQTLQYVITFVKYIVGGVAVLVLMQNALKLVSNASAEELDKTKKHILMAVIGLVLIIIADPIINDVLFNIDNTRYPSVDGPEAGINVTQGVREIVGFTNYVVTILAPIAVLVIIAGGVMYMTAAGDPEKQGKAKRMIMLALVGLIIIYGAFAIVSTFIQGQFDTREPTSIESTNP